MPDLSQVAETVTTTYTLVDLTALAEQYQTEKQGDSTEGLRRLFIGGLMEWLSAREARLIEEGE